MTAPTYWTLEKRLGYGLVAKLKADAGLFNATFGDRVEYAQDYIDVDVGQGPTVLIMPDLPADPNRWGDNWAETPFHFLAVIENWDDRQMGRTLAEAYQSLDVVFKNASDLLENYVTDTEANLASKCGDLKIRHELNIEDRQNKTGRQVRFILTVTHKRPLSYSAA